MKVLAILKNLLVIAAADGQLVKNCGFSHVAMTGLQ